MTRQRELRNVPASVHARLKEIARRHEVAFNQMLDRYAAERFLYRLSASPEVDRFTLKGAALLRVWSKEELRPTRDIDFLAVGRDDHDAVRTSLADVCGVPCLEDGVVFDARTIRVETIRQDQEYGGLRARIQGRLGQVRLLLQVDIGFGDAISPEREKQDYPTLLDLPVPRIWTYPRETLIAEKLEAMVSLGEKNTRVKDLWDIACLARRFAFDGETLRTAVAETFRRRGTSLDGEQPLALLPSYYENPVRAQRWQALQRQVGTGADGPARLDDTGDELRAFLGPVCASLIEGGPFVRTWPTGGPWQSGDLDSGLERE